MLLLALVVLVSFDAWLRYHRATDRLADSVLRPLVDPAREIVPERIRAVRLRAPGAKGEWRYERRGDSWRFPGYFDAYVHGDRMGSFLEILLRASGTRATDDPDVHSKLGVVDPQAFRVVLEGSDGDLAEFFLGSGIPGPLGEESYGRLAGQDLVLHLHVNPVRLLGAAQPSLLDPHLLPRGESRRAITEVRVTSPEQSYLLRRVLAPLPDDAPPLPFSEADRYRWVLEQNSHIDTCIDVNVHTWLAWLRSARFERLVNPDDDGYGLGSVGSVQLLDEENVSDHLRLGRAASNNAIYVGSDATGLVTVMPVERARWLLPPPDIMLQPLADPSPFESIP
ncbi:MAG TPA: hypothetical protein DIC52_13230 [Candidatus Latescibacteria bacterium]|nr:hypothetical protein [Candidatus Latescibacterota bacterium]|tara:strand:+ start:399 stop:1412 length:1014 start_codon:yes stop_codon:yes gene_type:complete